MADRCEKPSLVFHEEQLQFVRAEVKKRQVPSFRQSSWSESGCSCFIALTKNEELGRGASERGTSLFFGERKTIQR